MWLLARRDKKSFIAASFPILYFVAAALNNRAPFIRYIVPLCPAFAVAAAILCVDWMARPRWRLAGRTATIIVLGATVLYALAYMNVFRQPDARLAASQWLIDHVPPHTKILVEPSQNTPPMGSYYSAPDFNQNYVLFANPNGRFEKHDYFDVYVIDTYRFLYNPGVADQVRTDYLNSRLPLGDMVVIDDSLMEFYRHLPDSTHHVAKQFYDDLFAGRLGFKLAKTFKTYPSLFGVTINDDAAELTFRLFDHPRVYIFQRVAS